jgi:hypothetical protein
MTARRDIGLVVGAAVYGFFVFALLPRDVTAMNDDFGYYRSVAATLQHGRPWTYDWLEPWAFSLSTLSAVIFKLSGSFFAATIVLQAVLAALSFGFLARIFRDASMSPTAAILSAAALLSFPTLLWKNLEYTSLVIYLPSLLLAIAAAQRDRWAIFFIAWLVAAASRQGAAAWLLLPAVTVFERGMATRSLRSSARPAAALAAGIVCLRLLVAYANETHAQHYITQRMWSAATLRPTLANGAIALWIIFVAIGCAAFLTGGFRKELSFGQTRSQAARIVIGVLLLLTIFKVGSGVPLQTEHSGFDGETARWYLRGLVALAAAGWCLGSFSVRAGMVGAAAGCCALSCLRAELWDYYLLDGALFAFFSVRHREAAGSAPRLNLHGQAPLAYAVALLLLLFNLHASASLKRFVDYRCGTSAVLEHALRDGQVQPSELADMPFGFVAWHLFPYYLTHDGRASASLDGFGMYFERDTIAVRVEALSSRELRHIRSGRAKAEPPLSEIHPFGWGGHARYTLVRLKSMPDPTTAFKAGLYAYEPFPLNDAEWRIFLAKP